MLDIVDLKVDLDSDAGIVRAIDGLSLSIRRGETFALVGESGCGKSMTALALMRLLPDSGRIREGRIDLDGSDTLALAERDMRALRGGRIGMIFQEPGTSLNPVMRVGDQLVEAIETHTELRGDEARAKAVEWLERVGIPEPARRMDDYPFRMSGGQKQRVMIAMTLATEPDYLIADEPTTALDVTIQKQILELLKRLQREQGMGMLLITHDLAVVSGMAHRVALMYAGQIVEVASAEDFFRSPKHPYARALLEALPDVQRRGQALAAIPGTVPSLTQSFAGCRFAARCRVAQTTCSTQLPPWVEPTSAHAVRCVLPQGIEKQTWISPEDAPLGEGRAPVFTRDGHVEPGAKTNVLSVRSLSVVYPVKRPWWRPRDAATGTKAVDGVSFELAQARTLALVGESGCGKTTVGKAIVQLLRRTAMMEGDVLLDGQNLFELSGDALRRVRGDVQMIFQDPFASLDPRMRVHEILDEGLVSLRPEVGVDERKQRIAALCEQVGLRADALQRYPHEFSGGQRQRIAIARALAVQPKLIVCDEPTSALDVSVQAQILNLLRDIQRQFGVSYLFITHNIGVVEFIAHDVAVMQRGKMVEQGPADRVLGSPAVAYTKSLLAAVPRLTQAAF